MSDPKSALDSLYPFVGPVTSNPVSTSSLLESVHQKSRDSVRVQTEFFEQNADGVVEMAAGIAAVYRGGGRMFSMGNGGSSCDAAHFAVEFLHPVTAGRPALSVVNLSADSAMLSATGNDLGMEHVFSRSLSAHARSGDGVIGFSTSGESANLRRAFEQARSMQMRIWCIPCWRINAAQRAVRPSEIRRRVSRSGAGQARTEDHRQAREPRQRPAGPPGAVDGGLRRPYPFDLPLWLGAVVAAGARAGARPGLSGVRAAHGARR